MITRSAFSSSAESHMVPSSLLERHKLLLPAVHKTYLGGDLRYTQEQKEHCHISMLRNWRASLVAQWLRICLPMQETRVRALVWEDPTCRGAAGPVSHNY